MKTLHSQTIHYQATLSQEQKINLENVKRIMNSEKTILRFLRNIERKIINIETNKINPVLPYIPTNNITELNELIYAGAKLVREKIGIPFKKHEEKVKTGVGNSTGNTNEKTTKTSQNDKKKRGHEISRGKKELATQEKIIIQLVEINQNVLAKE